MMLSQRGGHSSTRKLDLLWSPLYSSSIIIIVPKEIIIKFTEEDAEEIINLLRDLLEQAEVGRFSTDQDDSGGDQDDQ